MSVVAPTFRLARPNVTREVGHAVLERRGLAAIFVVGFEHRPVVNVVVLERDEFAVGRGAKAHALLGSRA